MVERNRSLTLDSLASKDVVVELVAAELLFADFLAANETSVLLAAGLGVTEVYRRGLSRAIRYDGVSEWKSYAR